ncbi:exodeoxyribonuclease VII large subunit [Aliikangiella coralliicola]|uniref:Exodeoxyribonuclease 7 large subunit n=1 Tax=Aliikangiella coralliicola TaxID=2592383 RepID=A0A545TWD2_9GAMM|nr:exodeoxyribonuclease VII large subunit [Aliikangiella coralliicola]TQV81525.1 exodeoxyribonuclease VII large subunit [Aliikangiella coralliicola]
MIQPVLQPQQPPKRTLLTVSQLNQQAKRLLESSLGSVWLTGEISNLTKAASGHWYFSLKDDNAQIRCAMFRFKTQNMKFSPNEGDKVVVKGKVSLYEPRGDYQLIADYMEPAGLGDLQQQLNELMQKLKAQGLFAEERKRRLPFLPTRIGVITSPTGAAIHDVLNVLERRCPMVPVIIYPTQVQGASAVNDIIAALELAEKRHECDVLLLTRGGGSLEDLWCFNSEKLAHKIAATKIPIVAAIGHEVDTTISELVADLRAPTPSAAAEQLVPEQSALQQKLDFANMSMIDILSSSLQELQVRLNIARLKLADPANAIASNQHALDSLKHRLNFQAAQLQHKFQQPLDKISLKLNRLNPSAQLQNNQQKLSELKIRLASGWQKNVDQKINQLQVKANALETLSPLSTLNRGYSITRDQETSNVISSVKQLVKKQKVTLLMADGKADAIIQGIEPD